MAPGKPNRIVFLDRDGTINAERDLLTKSSELALLPGSAAGIRMLNEAGMKVVIVTNQPVVARNLCTEQDVERVNLGLLRMLSEEGARVDAVYFCPHHPERGHAGADDPVYRRECGCRKPKTGMLVEAARRFLAKPESCFMIGDSTRDIKAGNDFGATTILVRTGYGGKDGKYEAAPDYVADNLLEAAKLAVGMK